MFVNQYVGLCMYSMLIIMYVRDVQTAYGTVLWPVGLITDCCKFPFTFHNDHNISMYSHTYNRPTFCIYVCTHTVGLFTVSMNQHTQYTHILYVCMHTHNRPIS